MIDVAKILKPCGTSGEIKLEPFTKDTLFWKNLKQVEIDGKSYFVLSTRTYKTFVFIKLSEISTMLQAESLRGKIVFAKKEELNLNPDEYLISDLENCCVVDENQNILGYVESVESYGSADIINILQNGARRSFPFLNKVVKSVDISEGKIVVFKDKLDEVII